MAEVVDFFFRVFPHCRPIGDKKFIKIFEKAEHLATRFHVLPTARQTPIGEGGEQVYARKQEDGLAGARNPLPGNWKVGAEQPFRAPSVATLYDMSDWTDGMDTMFEVVDQGTAGAVAYTCILSEFKTFALFGSVVMHITDAIFAKTPYLR